MKITMKAARINAGMKAKEVARILKISPATIFSWENGKSSISAENLVKVCSIYGIDIADVEIPKKKM